MTTNHLLLCLCMLCLPISIFGQSTYSSSPTSLGRGATGVASTDIWSPIVNPATSSTTASASVSASYYLPYFINQLSTKNLLGILPFKYGVLSAYVNQYGYSLYQENKVGIAYARSLAPKLHASFQLNFKNINLSQSGSGSQLFAGIGLLYEPLDAISMGLYISNPERAKVTIMEEHPPIPSVFILGFTWSASDDFRAYGEMEKQDAFEALFKLGLEYDIKQKIWIRAGVFGKPINYTLGMGFDVMGFQLDAGIAHHDVLGISSCFGVGYLFKHK